MTKYWEGPNGEFSETGFLWLSLCQEIGSKETSPTVGRMCARIIFNERLRGYIQDDVHSGVSADVPEVIADDLPVEWADNLIISR
jgi:hypothetical protein